MAESNTNSISNQSKLLPSPFQNGIVQPPSNKSSFVSSNEVKLHGYRSNFDIKQQKQIYQQRKSHNFNQQRNPHNPNIDNNRQKKNIINVNSLNSRSNQKESGNWCDLCERGFKYPNQLQKHIDEHEKCWFENCTFEGQTKLLQAHIESPEKS